MSRVVFWNTQRTGRITDPAKLTAMFELVAGMGGGDYVLLCELSTKCEWLEPQNLTYREENAAQLCYAAYNAENYPVPLTRITPMVTPEYLAAGFKGGGRFENLASRALAYVGPALGVEVFAFHAPASEKARKAVCHAACWLDAEYGGTGRFWLMVGDFNVTPDELRAARVGIDMDYLIESSGAETHVSALGTARESWRELDYVLSNANVEVIAMPYFTWEGLSDHAPIIVEF
jgi:hypothetical protein